MGHGIARQINRLGDLALLVGFADSLPRLGFKTPAGSIVPLDSIVNFKQTVGPQTVNHSGQLPAVSLSFGLKPGVALCTAKPSDAGSD